MNELEYEEALETELEITDLDPQKHSSQVLNRWLQGQRFSLRTRLWMALLTLIGVALFSWLLVSPLHLVGASNLEKASNEHIFTSSNQGPSGYAQMLVVHRVIYTISQDGMVRAIWARHKYVFLLWNHYVAPSSKLLRVDHNMLYLASPDGRIVVLRASDGAVLWSKSAT